MCLSQAAKANYAVAVESLKGFAQEYGDEENCERIALSKLQELKTICCLQCGCETSMPLSGSRMMHCQNCKKEIWLTAGTFFHRVRIFRAVFGIIWLFEHGIIISANQAAKLFSTSTDTAYRIYKKLGIVINSQMTTGAVEVSSAQFLSIYSRRSRETPAREHPVEEEFAAQRQVNDDLNQPPDGKRTASLDKSELSNHERMILGILSQNPISFDQLSGRSKLASGILSATLMSLELDGFLARMPGDNFILATHQEAANSPAICGSDTASEKKTIALSMIYFVKDFFQGISRKYIQLFAPLHWISFDRTRWKRHSLFNLCFISPHISYKEILDFVTPLMVKLVPRYKST